MGTVGWVNNMSAQETYKQVYHLFRVLAKANKEQNQKMADVCLRLLDAYYSNHPAIVIAALVSYSLSAA